MNTSIIKTKEMFQTGPNEANEGSQLISQLNVRNGSEELKFQSIASINPIKVISKPINGAIYPGTGTIGAHINAGSVKQVRVHSILVLTRLKLAINWLLPYLY